MDSSYHVAMEVNGKEQRSYWIYVRAARYRRLERLSNTPIGALYIHQDETEHQARERIVEAEAKRLSVDYTKFKRLLDIKRKRNPRELKGKPPGRTGGSAQHLGQ